MSEERKQAILRPLLIVLALADLVLLWMRVGPLDKAMRLPGGGTTALDPAITLLAYIGISYWIGSARTAESRKCLFRSALIGLGGGAVLAGAVYFSGTGAAHGGAQMGYLQYGLMAVAVLLWGVAGSRTAKQGYQTGFSALCALWAGMFSCVIGAAALLGGSFLSISPGQRADPWAQYQGLAIGSESMQVLVQSLLTATGYLLIGPIVAVLAGTVFASFTRAEED